MNENVIWNAFINTNNLGLEGLFLQVGVKDILNSGYVAGMAYQDGFSWVPFTRRELHVRMIYTFKK
jgi:hypothetical protein